MCRKTLQSFSLVILASLCTGYSYSGDQDHTHTDHQHSDHPPSYPVVIPKQDFKQGVTEESSEIEHRQHQPRYGKDSRPDPSLWKEPRNSNNEINQPREGSYDPSIQTAPPQSPPPVTAAPPPTKYKYTKGPLDMKTKKYGYPSGCVKQDDQKDLLIEQTKCQYMLILNLYPNKLGTDGYAHFKMSRRMPKPYGYVAVGLSRDDLMNDDHIVECVKPGNVARPTMYHSWSNYHSRPTRLPDDSFIIKNKIESFDGITGILTCEFDRPLISNVYYSKGDSEVKQQVFDMTKENFFILMAVGETEKPDSDIIGKHGPRSFGTVSIFDPEYYYRSSTSKIRAREGSLLGILLIILSYYIW